MKTKIIALLLSLSAIFGSYQELSAQKNLNDLMKRCESLSNVHMNIVQERDKETKEVKKVIINVTISNDKKLVNDFLKAFERDKDNADRIVESIKNGERIPSLYLFKDGEKQISYSFSKQSESSASVTYIERKGKVTVIELGSFNFNTDELESRMESLGEQLCELNLTYAPKIEEWAKEFAPRIEEWAENLSKNVITSKNAVVNINKNGVVTITDNDENESTSEVK